MGKTNVKKLSIAGVLCAVAVIGSLFSIPMLGSRCAPVQHAVNILSAVLLGPTYGLGVAFSASLIRNILGLGSLMAFPGSMFGALFCGIIYWKTKNIYATFLAEVIGTGVVGGLFAYPVAILLMGQSAANIAVYAYVFPFFISTSVGALVSTLLIDRLEKSGTLHSTQRVLNG